MKTITTLLCIACLALIAGATFANITPDVQKAKLVGTSPIALSEYSAPALMKMKTLTATCEQSLGECDNLTLGFCDCDVPVPDFSCHKKGDINKQVWTCNQGAIICGIGANCSA